MTHRFIALVASLSFISVGCASADGSKTPATGDPAKTPVDTTPTTDPNAALDPVDDPVPSGLPELSAYSKESGGDVMPDLSCFGKDLPVSTGAPADREFHLIELGGADADRVGDARVDLFVGNEIDNTPDASVMAKKTEDKLGTGVFNASVPTGWLAYKVAPAMGYVPIVGLDLEVPTTGAVLPAVPTEEKVKLLSILIGGSSYEPTKGAGRAVVRIKDCALNALTNTHVVLEVDGKVRRPSKSEGLRRSYFSDTEFPGTSSWTTRSGVVAFLEIPPGAKAIRIVARGKVGGVSKVIAMRKIPLVADGLVAAKVMPFATH
jgi:hypothetical protein